MTGKRRILDLDAIRAADDRPIVEVDVPEWGGTVLIRPLSLDAFLRLREASTGPGGETDERRLTAELLAAALVGEDGEPLCTVEQAAELSSKSATALGRVMQAIADASGATQEALIDAQRRFPAGG